MADGQGMGQQGASGPEGDGDPAPAASAVDVRRPTTDPPPVVFICIPGLSEPATAVDSFANRFATALDEESPVPHAVYHVEPPATANLPAAANSSPRRIIEVVDGRSRPVADLYRLEYSTDLRKKFESASQARRSWLLGRLVVLTTVFQLLPALGRRAQKSAKAKAEIGFVLVIFFLLSLYTVVLLVAVIDAGWRAGSHNHALGPLQYVSLLFAAIGSFVPARLRKAVTEAAIDYYGVANYLGTGDRRSNEADRVSRMLEDVLDRRPEDTQVYVLAYSFGSIIALDTLFPPGESRGAHLGRINGLVTIGCPFDVVRCVWPAYFTTRAGVHSEYWLNVFDPIDVLGSNFVDGSDEAADPAHLPARDQARAKRTRQGPSWARTRQGPSWAGIGLSRGGDPCHPENLVWEGGSPGQRLTWPRVLMFSGLRAHAMYWDLDDQDNVGCLRPVVSRLGARIPSLMTRAAATAPVATSVAAPPAPA